jgi:tyrosine-protein kinase Etk/Wzc
MNQILEKQNPNSTLANVRETGLIGLLIVLAKHKRLVFGMPVAATVIAVIVSLVMPNVYRAATKIMPPQQSQSGATALLAQLGGVAGAAAAAAGIKSPNDLYIGMLKSRTVADHLIQRFDLQKTYEVDSLEKARRELERNTTIGAGKDGMIVIEVEDHDKKRAASLANAYVQELTKLTNVLAVTEAAQRRLFFEKQLELAKNNLAAAESKLKSGLDSNGVVSVDSESRAIVETIGRLRAQISAKEIELNSMKAFLTESNPGYQRVQQELNSLRVELSRLQEGSGSLSNSVTEKSTGLENVKLLRDVKYYQMLYELLSKQYEVARLDEAKEAAIIQVLDPAVEPERKAKPMRSLIVLATAVVSLLVSIVWAFVIETRERAMQLPEVREQWAELQRQLRRK